MRRAQSGSTSTATTRGRSWWEAPTWSRTEAFDALNAARRPTHEGELLPEHVRQHMSLSIEEQELCLVARSEWQGQFCHRDGRGRNGRHFLRFKLARRAAVLNSVCGVRHRGRCEHNHPCRSSGVAAQSATLRNMSGRVARLFFATAIGLGIALVLVPCWLIQLNVSSDHRPWAYVLLELIGICSAWRAWPGVQDDSLRDAGLPEDAALH